jgi:DNA polymerase-3 subunit epsilon
MFLDIETTGLHPERGAVTTEIALLDGGGIRLHWSQGDAGNPLSDILPEVFQSCSRGVIVGHNVSFDLSFLAHEAGRARQRGPKVRYIDTLALARRHTDADGITDHRLESLVQTCGLHTDPDELHDAITDARTCRQLLWTIAERHDLNTLQDAGLSQMSWGTI